MKKRFILAAFTCVFALLLTGCKSEFEKIRASGDTDLIYKKAFELYEQEEYLRAQTLFELIIPAYRGRPELKSIDQHPDRPVISFPCRCSVERSWNSRNHMSRRRRAEVLISRTSGRESAKQAPVDGVRAATESDTSIFS